MYYDDTRAAYSSSDSSTVSELSKIEEPVRRERRNELPKAWPIEFICKNRKLDTFIHGLADRIIELNKTQTKKAPYRENVVFALRQLILNFYVTVNRSQKLYLVVPKSKRQYGAEWMGKRGYTWAATVDVLNGLSRLGYIIDEKKGYSNPETGKSAPSCYRASKSQINRTLNKYIQLSDVRKKPRKEIISLRYPKKGVEGEEHFIKGRNITYRANRRIVDERAALKGYNDLMKLADVKLAEKYLADCSPEEVPIFPNRETYRVYTRVKPWGDFESHGRFYGPWWVNVSSKLRNYITINNEPTVELDFRTFHPLLLYCMLGLDPQDYAYEGDLYGGFKFHGIEGNALTNRNLAKKLLNASLNALDIGDVPKTVMKDVYFSKKGSDYSTARDFRPNDPMLYRGIKLIFDRHKPLREYIGCGYGFRLMYLDAKIAEKVMEYFTDIFKEPVLMVHDSFLVRSQFEGELEASMIRAFYEVVRAHTNSLITVPSSLLIKKKSLLQI